MRKAFLRTPLDIFRISSGFNLRRKHPIHKKIRAHRGVDYAAPTGTPVYSSGDGRVLEAGYTKANGNYVFIQHGQTYITKYIHLHRKKVRTGQSVKQRQIIGTVGATGYATGPHLHYEFLVNGVHRNPRTVSLPKANPISANERSRFNKMAMALLDQLTESQQASQLVINW
jgi:murein DD-endopeptidase MepM/ murein hydrolase activator NlpD